MPAGTQTCTFLSKKQFSAFREKLIARCPIFEGMRPGEILAFRWRPVKGTAVTVAARVHKRVLKTQERGKTREGAISGGTLKLLNE
jgi:integrase